jgi:hypothetical protein
MPATSRQEVLTQLLTHRPDDADDLLALMETRWAERSRDVHAEEWTLVLECMGYVPDEIKGPHEWAVQQWLENRREEERRKFNKQQTLSNEILMERQTLADMEEFALTVQRRVRMRREGIRKMEDELEQLMK